MIRSLFALLALPMLSAGCSTMSGAAQTVHLTDRGANAEVKGSVTDVNQRAKAAFEALNIQMTGSSVQQSGSQQEIDGKKDNMDVVVKMTNSPNSTTGVEVTAREGLVKWNKDFAKEVLSQIVNRG